MKLHIYMEVLEFKEASSHQVYSSYC